MFFSKQKHETVFDNSAFREALNRELLKYDLNNIEYDTLDRNYRFSLKCAKCICTFKEKISQSKSCKFFDKGNSKSNYAKNKT